MKKKEEQLQNSLVHSLFQTFCLSLFLCLLTNFVCFGICLC